MFFNKNKRSREIKQKGKEVEEPPINKTRKKHIKVITDTKAYLFQDKVENFINDENIILDHNPIYSTATITNNSEEHQMCKYVAFIKYERLVD